MQYNQLRSPLLIKNLDLGLGFLMNPSSPITTLSTVIALSPACPVTRSSNRNVLTRLGPGNACPRKKGRAEKNNPYCISLEIKVVLGEGLRTTYICYMICSKVNCLRQMVTIRFSHMRKLYNHNGESI